MSLSDLQALVGVGSIPIVVGLVKIAKPYFPDKRLWPLLAVMFGVLFNLLLATLLTSLDLRDIGMAAVLGLMAGMGASGGYSGYKAAVGR